MDDARAKRWTGSVRAWLCLERYPATMNALSRIEVVLDHPDRFFGPGDRITGAVRLVTDNPVTCERIVIEQRWHARRADGERKAVTARTLTLDTTIVPDGDPLRFEFTAVPTPITYRGRALTIGCPTELDRSIAPRHRRAGRVACRA